MIIDKKSGSWKGAEKLVPLLAGKDVPPAPAGEERELTEDVGKATNATRPAARASTSCTLCSNNRTPPLPMRDAWFHPNTYAHPRRFAAYPESPAHRRSPLSWLPNAIPSLRSTPSNHPFLHSTRS